MAQYDWRVNATRRELGVEKGNVFPAGEAGRLFNPLRRLVQSPRRIVDALELRTDSRVLEVGCGPGYFSLELAGRARRGRVHLFDLQRGMLDLSASRLRERGLANFEAVVGDATALPYRSECFDAALLVTVLGEVPDPGACIDEVRRVLKPGGRLVVSEVVGDPDFHPAAWTRVLAEASGFRFARRRGTRWNYTMTFVKDAEATAQERARR